MQTRSHRTASTLLLGAALASIGCTPRVEPRHYELAAETREALADQPAVQEQILGALDMLFGTPEEPRYMLVADWVDSGFDPNWPKYAEDDGGSGEFTDEALEAIYAGNEVRFAHELGLVDAGRFAEIGPIRHAPGLQQNIDYVREHPDEFDDLAGELKRTLREYYPSLRDSAELYRQHCLHCHGNSGGGDGPTSSFLNPLPRDYRHGVFKFTAVKDKAMPRREDLFHVLAQGVTGTAMPSFRRFSDAELEGLVDYVRVLSKRGMTERLLLANYQSSEALTPEMVTETYLDVFGRWDQAADKYIAFEGEIPAPTPELIARGREIFNDDKKGNCASCHGVTGLGDGASAYKVDEQTGKRVPAYQDDWGHPILPRNLTLGIFRGGRRPIDIYRRIYAGINGTPMPGLGESKDAQGNPLLPSEDMWALVHYVRSLSERPNGIGIEPHPFVTHGPEESASHGGEHAAGPEEQSTH